MSEIEESIEKFDYCLSRKRPLQYRELLPGLAETDLESIEQHIGVTLPEDFRALYRWRNGQPSDSERSLIGDGAKFMNKDEIISEWHYMQQTLVRLRTDNILQILQPEDWWNPNWLPFWMSVSGTLLCLDTAGSFSGASGQIVQYIQDEEFRMVVAPNLEALINAMTEAVNLDVLKEGVLVNDLVTNIYPEFPWGYPDY